MTLFAVEVAFGHQRMCSFEVIENIDQNYLSINSMKII
jgi:hypothetical protein